MNLVVQRIEGRLAIRAGAAPLPKFADRIRERADPIMLEASHPRRVVERALENGPEAVHVPHVVRHEPAPEQLLGLFRQLAVTQTSNSQ